MMRRKMFTGLLMSAALCVLVPTLVYAASGTEKPEHQAAVGTNNFAAIATPRYNYTSSVGVLLAFDGYDASCVLVVDGYSNATKNTGTLSLQKKSSSGTYSTVKSWSINESSGTVRVENSYTVSSTNDYRLIYSGKVYAGSAYENVSCDAKMTCK